MFDLARVFSCQVGPFDDLGFDVLLDGFTCDCYVVILFDAIFGCFLVKPILVTFDFVLLLPQAEHENALDLVFFDHSPEMLEGRIHRTLACDYFFVPLNANIVSVYVVFNRIAVSGLAQLNPGGLKSHDVGIPVQAELVGVLVEFFDVVLRLCHEF